MYIEAYGNTHRGYTFIAARFTRPVVRVRFKDPIEPIRTDNILVLYSDTHRHFDTLTFAVNAKCPGAVQVDSGSECNLLLAMFDVNEIYMHSFHDSILYVVGTNKLNFKFESCPKTVTFRALYTLTKHGLENSFDFEHFGLVKYFVRNNLSWKKWNSWWNLLLKILKTDALLSKPLSIQLAKRVDGIYKNSRRDFVMDYTDLYKCEIELCERPFLGIIYKTEDNAVVYVSPMIVSRDNADKSFNDVNQVVCNRWLPLYFNKNIWLVEGIYFYLRDLKEKTNELKQVLNYLEGTSIEKYSFMQRDLKVVYDILTS